MKCTAFKATTNLICEKNKPSGQQGNKCFSSFTACICKGVVVNSNNQLLKQRRGKIEHFPLGVSKCCHHQWTKKEKKWRDTLPVQKFISAEELHTEARQGKLSSILATYVIRATNQLCVCFLLPSWSFTANPYSPDQTTYFEFWGNPASTDGPPQKHLCPTPARTHYNQLSSSKPSTRLSKWRASAFEYVWEREAEGGGIHRRKKSKCAVGRG